MITIYDEKGKKLASIANDDDFNHIPSKELLEVLGFHQTPDWRFITYFRDDVMRYHYKMTRENMNPKSIPTPFREAYSLRRGLIEMCEGDSLKPSWVIMPTDLDIGEIKKKWYINFCKNHLLTVIDSANESRQET
ncbi:MAG: hypothetical protein WCO72_14905 [Betaproteobacteria bacterium]